jgi:hypothetical protein
MGGLAVPAGQRALVCISIGVIRRLSGSAGRPALGLIRL